MSETGRKRSRPESKAEDEIEIDVDADEPLSKRAARRLKKGRTLKQAPSSHALPEAFSADPPSEAESEGSEESSSSKPKEERKKTKDKKDKKDRKDKKDKKEKTTEEPEYKKGTNGIWIGNLAFRTTEQDLTTFFSTLKPLGKAKPASEYATIGAGDIVRISLPAGERKGTNKGFAYLDFRTPEQCETAMALSERILQGRNVLIKSADSSPPAAVVVAAAAAAESKATKILYVGNLSFDVTAEDLEAFLGGAGAGVKRVRMATFQDSGKCKGFAFCDFHASEQVERVLKNRQLQSMNGRKLKMEFGEDRSLRRKPQTGTDETAREHGKVDPRSIKPGMALMNAQRASHAILPSKGQKQAFD